MSYDLSLWNAKLILRKMVYSVNYMCKRLKFHLTTKWYMLKPESVPENDTHKIRWNFEIRGAFNKFPDFFVQAFKIVVHSWKFSMLLLYIIWDDWPIFMISGSNQQLQQELEYTLLKPDCHSWWISKMQSGRSSAFL